MDVETAAAQEVVIRVGDVPILVRSDSREFAEMLEARYAGFLAAPERNGEEPATTELDVELRSPRAFTEEEDTDISVRFEAARWIITRGDLRAELEPNLLRGRVRQHANPYSIDAVIRITHSLVLARAGGLLMHASSCVRKGQAYLFAGVSGAGKTTISRLAPPEATLLTDEISYLRRDGEGYSAYGTPFAGELAKPGENVRAPLGALYLLRQGLENRIEPLASESEAVRRVMENVLFFANDPDLVSMVFDTVYDLVRTVPVYRLTFTPDPGVWELIGN